MGEGGLGGDGVGGRHCEWPREGVLGFRDGFLCGGNCVCVRSRWPAIVVKSKSSSGGDSKASEYQVVGSVGPEWGREARVNLGEIGSCGGKERQILFMAFDGSQGREKQRGCLRTTALAHWQ